MKKVLSLLLVSVLAVGNVGFAATPAKTTVKAPVVAEVSKQGYVTGFTAMSVTVMEMGKSATYKLDAKTVVTSMGMEANFADVIMKGLAVTFKAKGSLITKIEIPGAGQQTQGIPTPFMITDIRENVTDDADLPANSATVTYTRTDIGVLPSEDFSISADGTTITIGLFVVVEDSIKLMVGEKAITLVKGEFDAKVAGDEAKFAVAKNVATITMETPLTADEQKVVKLNYDRKNFNLKAVETTNYLPAENLVAELNGKAVSLQKALNRSNYAYVTTNLKGEVVYLNAIYKEMTAKFVKAEKGIIYFAVERNGEVAFTDAVRLDSGATVMDKNGAWTNYTKIKKGTEIMFTVDPGMGYAITYLQTK